MPLLLRGQTGLPFVFALLFLTLLLGASVTAQDQPLQDQPVKDQSIKDQLSKPATAAQPVDQVFPPAVAASSQPDKAQADDGTGPEPTLGNGDLLEISVYNVPELSTKSRLGNSGDVYLPLIDYVHLAGLTVAEGQALIEKRLTDGGFVKNPHVTLLVDQSQSQGASLLGEVARPGVYPIIGEPRLLDVISAAGGFTDKAGQSITVTHRNQSDKPVNVPLNRKLTDNPASNISVSPGRHDTRAQSRCGLRCGRSGQAQRISDGQRQSDGLEVDRAGGRHDSHGQNEWREDHPQRAEWHDRNPGAVEKDASGQSRGHSHEGGRHPVCPQQYQQSDHEPFRGRCRTGCQRGIDRSDPTLDARHSSPLSGRQRLLLLFSQESSQHLDICSRGLAP